MTDLTPTTPFASQWKQVTVLFADLALPPLPPEAELLLLTRVWQQVEAVVGSYGGMVEKHARERAEPLMALFGVPRAREDDPERAIRAALAMQAAMTLLPPASDTPTPTLRIGISTGPILLNASAQGDSYTAMGQAVTVASTLSQSAPVGGIVIAQDTHRHIEGLFNTQPLDPLPLAGSAAPIARLLVRGELPRTFRLTTRGVQGVESRMVGREQELSTLKSAVTHAQEEGLQVVSIVGEAGVGKSRLLHEFSQWLEHQPVPIRLCKGRADLQMHAQSYSLIRDLFAYQFGIREGDRAVMARAKLEQGLRLWLGTDSTERAHTLGHLLGFDFSESPYLHGILDDPRQIRDRAFHYAARFFAALATEREGAQLVPGPLVIVLLEDIHWADEGSLELIDYLVQTCQAVPMVLLCSARPAAASGRAAWGKGWPEALYSQVNLEPLSQDASRQLVAELLSQVEKVPPELEELIVQRAEGNPFYVEELVKMLIEDGVIERQPERWTIALERLAALRIPPTLTGVLQARLDALPDAERDILQRAAVVGRLFWDSAVAFLGGDKGESLVQVRTRLTPLQEKGLVVEQPNSALDGTREYLFHHALLQEVAYDSLPKRRRQWYHAQVASWLIEQSGERVPLYAGQIGQHYEAADRGGAAVEWYGWAAQQARAAHVPQTAIDYYHRALALTPAKPDTASQRLEMLEGLGEMLWLQARYAEAIEVYTTMRSVAEALGDAGAQARSWEGTSRVQGSQGAHEGALASAQAAETVARTAGELALRELAGALTRVGICMVRLDRLSEAQEVLEQALTLSTRLDARQVKARALNILGSLHNMWGQYAEARRYFEQALEIFREFNDRRGMGVILNNLGWGARTRGDHQAAIPLYREALTLVQETGDRRSEGVLHSNLGGALVGAGEFGAAEVELRQSIAISDTLAAPNAGESYRFLAEALLGQGRIVEAWEAAYHALRLAKRRQDREQLGSVWRVLGRVGALADPALLITHKEEESPIQEPRRCFAQSIALLESQGAEREQAQTLRAWAQYEQAQGEVQRSQDLWQQALLLFRRSGMEEEGVQRLIRDESLRLSRSA